MSHSVETRWRNAKDQGLHYKRFSPSPAHHGTTNQGLTTAGGSGNGEKRWLSIANSESWANRPRERCGHPGLQSATPEMPRYSPKDLVAGAFTCHGSHRPAR